MTNETRYQDMGMEPAGKIIKCYTYAWKLALPSIGENIDDDDGGDVDLDGESMNDGDLITVIPISGDLEQSVETTWDYSIWRTFILDSNRKEITDISVDVYLYESEVVMTGFYKISITDKAGKILPGQIKYASVNKYSSDDDDYDVISVRFEGMNLPGNSKDKHLVCFELHIAVDERETSDFNRSTNDLGLLLDESLLTDSVLCVSGTRNPGPSCHSRQPGGRCSTKSF